MKALNGKNTGVFFRGELGIMISAGQINTGLSLKKPPRVAAACQNSIVLLWHVILN